MGILSFPIFGTHKIWGILSQDNFSLGDYVGRDICQGGFFHGDFVIDFFFPLKVNSDI